MQVRQTVRVYNDTSYVEIDYNIGPMTVGELIFRFRTNINSGGVFYTDANGREMVQRRRVGDIMKENYYPVTNRMYIEDSKARFTVVTDRSQGLFLNEFLLG